MEADEGKRLTGRTAGDQIDWPVYLLEIKLSNIAFMQGPAVQWLQSTLAVFSNGITGPAIPVDNGRGVKSSLADT
jgi:hypothetical protein